MKLKVRVQAGASFNRVERLEDGSIKVHLTARPYKNEANKALLTLPMPKGRGFSGKPAIAGFVPEGTARP